jgi:hypothetical protein
MRIPTIPKIQRKDSGLRTHLDWFTKEIGVIVGGDYCCGDGSCHKPHKWQLVDTVFKLALSSARASEASSRMKQNILMTLLHRRVTGVHKLWMNAFCVGERLIQRSVVTCIYKTNGRAKLEN